MWICQNCKTENEDNFKFCWGCGQTREQSKTVELKQQSKEMPKPSEPEKKAVREVRRIEEVKKVEEIKPAEVTKVEPRRNPQNEPELFSTVLPYSAKSSSDETDWEIKVFRVAVRLVGLFLLYHVFVALPDLVNAIYSDYAQSRLNADNILTKEFIAPTLKLAFYFIVGIYLIVSGRILIWLLPNR